MSLSKTIKYIEAAFDTIMNISAVFAGVLVVLIMLCVCMDVIMRYFFNNPLLWVVEMGEYAMLYITFIGAAWLLKIDGHVTIDILTMRMSGKKRNIFGMITSIIGVFISGFFVYYGALVTWDHFARGVYNPSLLQFPKAPLIAVIPFGAFLLLFQFIRNTLFLLHNINTK